MRESMKQLNDSSGLSQKSFSPHRPPEGIQEGLTYTKETLTESLIWKEKQKLAEVSFYIIGSRKPIQKILSSHCKIQWLISCSTAS